MHEHPFTIFFGGPRWGLSTVGLRRVTFAVACIGPIEPENGLDLAVKAMARLLEELPDAALLIAGPAHPDVAGEAHVQALRSQTAKAGVGSACISSGPSPRRK